MSAVILSAGPRPGGAGLLPLLDRLSAAPVESGDGYASIADAADHVTRLIRPGSLVAVISDFAGLQLEHSGWLAQLATGRELLLILVHDALEADAPPPERYPVADDGRPGAGIGLRTGILDLTSLRVRDAYQARFQQRLETLARLARRDHAHWLRLATHQPVGVALARGLGARTGSGMVGVWR